MAKPHSYWNKDRCLDDALRHHTRTGWAKESNGAYCAALKNGWLDECCHHMQSRQKPTGYWNKENCKNDALNYHSRKEWECSSPSAYGAALKNDWIDECCAHMARLRVPKGYWTLDRCKQDALSYKTRAEWREAYPLSYAAAKRNGWLDLCCGHMVYLSRPNGYWTLERCIADAEKYDTRSLWMKSSPSAYDAAHRNGWLDDCKRHMVELQKPSGYWSIERCALVASSYASKKEWQMSDWASYKAAYKNNWIDEVCSASGIPNFSGSLAQMAFADRIRDEIQSSNIDVREEVKGLAGKRTRVDMVFYRKDVPILAVEYHGAHWHTEAFGKSRNYHRSRLLALRENGVRLITVHAADADSPVVMSMIRSALGLVDEKIRASKCEIVRVNDGASSAFYDYSHIQGGRISGRDRLNLGLKYDGRLVACMTFVRSTDRHTGGGKYDWCLHRFATVPDCRVMGAAGRLFNRFRDEFPTASVVSYCDLQFFDGRVYRAIGFKHVRDNAPDYRWVRAQTVLAKHEAQRKFLPNLLGEAFDPALSERENMERAGYNKMWDCGKAVYVFTL